MNQEPATSPQEYLLEIRATTPADSPSQVDNPYLFQGRRFDAETGLYQFRNRDFDPITGRFLQRDPVWDDVNKGGAYAFTGNNPVSLRDPSGEFVPVLIAAAAAGGAIAYFAYNSEPSAEQAAARQKLEAAQARQASARAAALRQARCDARRAENYERAMQQIEAMQSLIREHQGHQMWGEGSSGFQLSQRAAYHEDRRRRWQQAHDIYVSTYAALGGFGSLGAPRRIASGRQFTSARRVTSNVRRAKELGITRGIESMQHPLEILGLRDMNRGFGRFAKPKTGYGDIFVHGNSQGLSIRNSQGQFEPLDLMAFQILAEEAGMAGRKIRLISCETGANLQGAAQSVANWMRVEVMAPKEKVYVQPDTGKIAVWDGPRAGKEPTWITFKPE